MPRKGGLRVGLIHKLADSYFYALGNDDYQTAGVHLMTLAKFLDIRISPVPMVEMISPSEATEWRNYCFKHEGPIFAEMNRTLKIIAKANNPLQVMKGDGFEEDFEDDI